MNRSTRTTIAAVTAAAAAGLALTSCTPNLPSATPAVYDVEAAGSVAVFGTGSLLLSGGWQQAASHLTLQRGLDCTNIWGVEVCKRYETVADGKWRYFDQKLNETVFRSTYSPGMAARHNCTNSRDRRAYRAVLVVETKDAIIDVPGGKVAGETLTTPWRVLSCG